MRNVTHRTYRFGFNHGPIDPLSVFSFMFSIAILFHFLSGPGDTAETFHPDAPLSSASEAQAHGLLDKLVSAIDLGTFAGVVTLLLALLLVLNPRSIRLFVLMAVSQVCHYFIISPNGSNHYIMDTFMCLTICVCALFFLRNNDNQGRRADFYSSFASGGRYFLVLMYFFGIFHKINPGFLNPDLSCAVALTYGMTSRLGIEDQQWIKYAAIWGTFIMEGIAMLVLFSRRWKFWGFVIGIPFHLVVAFSGYRFFIEYSSLAIALYCLFLPQEFYSRINDFVNKIMTTWRKTPEQFWKRVRIAFIIVGILTGLYAVHVFLSGGRSNPYEFIYGMMPVFAIYGLGSYIVILYFSRNIDPQIKEPMYTFPKPLIAVFPILFFLNGFGPYLGWKTESSISMFSHLHTEGSRTNHLMFDRLPQIFDYQKKLVKIISSPDPRMQRFVDTGHELVYFELRRFVTQNPGVPITYEIDHVRYEFDGDNSTGEIEPVPWWLHKILLFKPVDNHWPKNCTH